MVHICLQVSSKPIKSYISKMLTKQIGKYRPLLNMRHQNTYLLLSCLRVFIWVRYHLEYNNFEKKIMEGKGVIIEGWTYPTITNPSNFKSLADIKHLYDAIHDGTCKAVKLSQQEWNSHITSSCIRMAMGEDVYPNTLYNQKFLGKQKAKGSRQLRIPSCNQSVVVTNHLTSTVRWTCK